jgi:hypothetical protein
LSFESTRLNRVRGTVSKSDRLKNRWAQLVIGPPWNGFLLAHFEFVDTLSE